jgi:hypothetical protein
MAGRSTAGWTSEARRRQSAVLRAALSDPDVRAHRSALTRELWTDPDYRDAVSAGLKRAWSRRRARLDSQQPETNIG